MPTAFDRIDDPLADLRRRFVERTRARLDILRRALATDALDVQAIAPVAHQLAGSAGTFGHAELGSAAAALEDAARAAGEATGVSDPETIRSCLARLEAAFAALDVGAPSRQLAGGAA